MNRDDVDQVDRSGSLPQPGSRRSLTPGERRLPGVELADLTRRSDDRGWFLKVFEAEALAGAGCDASVKEVFVSTSHRGVVRGLHFQTPPKDHAKTVVCLAGRAFDVVVDLRRGSPTEGQAATFLLDGNAPARLHVPTGLAHGFQALRDGTVMAYVTSTAHAPEHDHGVRWDSIDVDWPLPPTAVSDRDRRFPPFESFTSPFTWSAAAAGA